MEDVFQDASVKQLDNIHFSEEDKNQVIRTPNTQIRITSVFIRDRFTAFLTLHCLGKCFNNFENTVELNSYSTLDAGVDYWISNYFQVQLRGRNLFNSLGLTEGNANGTQRTGNAKDRLDIGGLDIGGLGIG